ncbi:hypothetical protein LY474_34770 [Myxococcus stipitatus]|uniref:Trm112 family protein n=1 Tax=Myxococcus stipitatus TaxID=83455 RepID=UPI001F2AAB87|nr:Trm112 family protein [Myxococcus stipitatus]MCE9672984.1 hypothetical protein [Myxococcus stipitatus]
MSRLDATLLAVLGCPDCHGPLAQREVASGTELCCEPCLAAWPVEEGVPQLLPESRRPRGMVAPG